MALDRAAVRRLVALEETGRLGVEQVELAAGGLECLVADGVAVGAAGSRR